MKKSISRPEAEKIIGEFFGNIKDKSSNDVKKIKRLAMSYKIKLGERRKLFCKKCLMPYKIPRIRVKDKVKAIKCGSCGSTSRWRMK